MQKTTNYQLNQWEPSDPIRREDFNETNAAIDAAIKQASDAAAQAGTAAGAAQNTAQAAYTALANKAEKSAVTAVETELANYKTTNDATVAKKAETDTVAALSQRLSAAYSADNLPWESGVLDLTDADSGDVAKTFDFEPSAILLGAKEISPGFGINGGSFRMDEFSSSSRYYFALRGNELIATTVSGAPVTELQYLALK